MNQLKAFLTSRLVALFVAVGLGATSAQAWFLESEQGSLGTAKLSELPIANDHQGELWHLNVSPLECTGCTTAYASTKGTRTVNAYATWGSSVFRSFVHYPGGWEFRHVGDSCLSSKFEARKIGSQEVKSVALLQKGRLQGYASRRLSCMGGGSQIYYGIVANSRYLAFKSAEPGFIFFDLQEGRFVPWALTAERPSGGMNLYADQSGDLYVDDGFSPSAERNIHKVVLGGFALSAPLSKEAICQAREIAKRVGSPSISRPAPGFECE